MRTRVVPTIVGTLYALLLWVLFASSSGCSGATDLQNGLVSCSDSGQCPVNYYCAGDGKCWQNGATPALDGSAPDARTDAGDAGKAGDGTTGCPAGLVECGGACVNPMTDPSHCGATSGCGTGGMGSAGTACKNGLVCNGGTCAVSCPGMEVNCSGACVDPSNDPTHCGATTGCGVGDAGSGGTACGSGQVCSKGACAASCTATQTNCSGSCVDTKTDPSHCGACATVCALPHVMTDACVAGVCVWTCARRATATATDRGQRLRDPDEGDGRRQLRRVRRKSHYENATASCTAGACALGTCAAGFADCDGNPANGCETNTAGDVANCGACKNACAGGQVCSSSACTTSCGAGLVDCSGSCVNTTVNVQHCGSCATACALPNVTVNACASSNCVVGGCAAGFGDCDGVTTNGCETATGASDVNNCGGCGIKCTYPNAGATCSSGTCAPGACKAGFADCDGVPTNGCETSIASDSANCGACGNACGGGQVCSAGKCGTTCGGTTTNCSGSCVNEATTKTTAAAAPPPARFRT